MRHVMIVIGMSVLLIAVALLAQTPAPKPGPEQKKLEIWVGDWTYAGDTKATPLGPAGKDTGKMSVKSILGGFFVEFQGEEKGPGGTSQWSEIDSYNPVTKKYAWNGFGSDGGISTVNYTIEGNTVSYSGTQILGGKEYKIRGTCVFSPDFMSFVEKRELSVDGASWMPLFDSKCTKVKSLPK